MDAPLIDIPAPRICLFAAIGERWNDRVPGLGDLITKNAVMRLLSRQYPRSTISLVAGPRLLRRAGDFFLKHAYVHELIACPEIGTRSWPHWGAFVIRMRRRRFDLAIIDPSSKARAFHAYLCGIRQRIGMPDGTMHDRFLTRPVVVHPARGQPHLFDFIRGYAEAFGVTGPVTRADVIPRFPFTPEPALARPPGPLTVAVHPGGERNWNRRWPLERYQEICLRLCLSLGATVYVVGNDAEAGETRRIVEHVRAIHPSAAIADVTGRTLNTLANHLDACHVFVGNDSSPMHVTAALGKPVVVIGGPAATSLWEPMYAGTVVSRRYPCQELTRFSDMRHRDGRYSCREFACPYAFDSERPVTPRCLADISVDDVWSAILRQIGIHAPAVRHA